MEPSGHQRKDMGVICRYGTQSVMKVGLNQPIMREVVVKLMGPLESDGLTEYVTEDSADGYPTMKGHIVKRAKKGLKRLKSKAGSKRVNHQVIKSNAKALMSSGMRTGKGIMRTPKLRWKSSACVGLVGLMTTSPRERAWRELSWRVNSTWSSTAD